jgi:hypothetical protein
MQGLHELSFRHTLVKEHPKLDGCIDHDEKQQHQPMQGNKEATVFESRG